MTDKFIIEEYEKNERRVPQWKIKWCQDNLKYMIGKDDIDQSLSLVRQKTTASGAASKMKKSGNKRRQKTRKGKEMQSLAKSMKE